MAATPDGCRAVSVSYDRTLKVWDLETGIIVASFTSESPIFCCVIAPDGVTIAPDGVIIVAGEASGRVHFIRLENA